MSSCRTHVYLSFEQAKPGQAYQISIPISTLDYVILFTFTSIMKHRTVFSRHIPPRVTYRRYDVKTFDYDVINLESYFKRYQSDRCSAPSHTSLDNLSARLTNYKMTCLAPEILGELFGYLHTPLVLTDPGKTDHNKYNNKWLKHLLCTIYRILRSFDPPWAKQMSPYMIWTLRSRFIYFFETWMLRWSTTKTITTKCVWLIWKLQGWMVELFT